MGFLENVLKKLTLSDHRNAERLESPLLVAYYWDGSTPSAHQIKNISSVGFYLLTEERLRPGTVITMTLQRPSAANESSSSQPHLTVMSMVIRQDQDGVGFAFLPQEPKDADQARDLSRPASRRAIHKFLEQIKSDGDHTILRPHPVIPTRSPSCCDRGSAGRVMNRLAEENGQALVLTALCMTCLLGFMALAADVGIMLRERRLLQIAADSAAIAGAAELNFGDASSAAQAAAVQNGFTNGSGGATITVNTPPAFGPHASVTGYVEVIASKSQSTIFMGLFGRSAMTVTARAVATNGAGSSCMYLLGSSGPDIEMTGTGSLNVPDCGILDDSNSNTSAITDSGTGSITAKSIGVVGSPGFNNSGTGGISPTPTPGIVAASDPLSFITQPTPSGCTPFSNGGTSAITLQPGCYSSLSITGTGPVTLSPGLYVLNGPVILSGTGSITGSGVTLYLTSATGAVTISGTQAINLSAPTTGNYNGILFFEQRGDTNQLTVSGTGNMNLTGIFYLPSATLALTGTSNATFDAAFVVSQLLSSGTGTVTLSNFALTNTSTPLTSVRLVE